MKPIIVIPTYNEKDNITKLINQILALEIPNLDIIVVDDNSPDGTADIVAQLPVRLIKRPSKLGLGSAYIMGFKQALNLGANYILEMDADFSHDPNDIPRLLSAAQTADLVIGSRKINGGQIIGWGPIRKFMSHGAMWLSRRLLNLKAKDVTAGFRCYRRQVLETITLDKITSNGYAWQEEMLYRTQQANFSITEIPVIFNDRQAGKSKLGKKDILEFFLTIFKLKFGK